MASIGGIDLSGLLSAVGQGTKDLLGAFRPETANPTMAGLGNAGQTDLWAGLSYGQNPALGGLGGASNGNAALSGLGATSGGNVALNGLGGGKGWAGMTGADLGAAIGSNPLWTGAENARNAWGQQQAQQQAAEQARRQATQPFNGGGAASGGAYGNHEQYRQWIQQYAQANGIDPDALAAILQIESPSGDPKSRSGAGAMGLGQIMPGTWAGLADPGDDPYDPQASIKNAAKYYAQQYRQFGDYALAAAAYQGGPGAIVNGKARGDINDGNMTPEQYAAHFTQNYQGIKAAAPKAAAGGNAAVATAQQFTGLAYTNEGIRVTGNPRDGFDCSSLTGYVNNLPRNLWNAQAQYDYTARVNYADMQVGDLIFFRDTVPPGSDPSAKPVTHVGIYAGNGMMTHSGDNGVQTVALNTKYWNDHYYGSGRITRQAGDNTGQR